MTLAKAASFRQIATFHAVARLGSVSLAAQELHLSQSAVSIQISTLEAAAGAPLVSRTGRGVRLTEAGELLVTYADRLVALWNETSDEMTTFLGSFSGTLRVGAVTTAEYWLPRLLVRFAAENARVKLKLQVANRDEIVRALGKEEIDIAVMGQPPVDFKVEAAAIANNPMVFVASPGHALMSRPRLTMARLAAEPLVVRERGSGTRTTLERLFKQAGLRPRIGSELSSNEAIKQMCAAGFAPAFVSLHSCVLELDAGLLALLPLASNPIQRKWFVVRLAARQLPQVAVAFELFLRQHAQEAVQQQLQSRHEPAPAPAPSKRAARRSRAST